MIRLLVIVPYPELKEIVDYVLAHHPVPALPALVEGHAVPVVHAGRAGRRI